MWRLLVYSSSLACVLAIDADSINLYDKMLKRMDKDADGKLSVKELKAVSEWVRHNLNSQYVAFGDNDRDGIVSLAEFDDLMATHKQSMREKHEL